MNVIDGLDALTSEARTLAENMQEIAAVDLEQLTLCSRELLRVLETLALIYSKHPSTIQKVNWRDLLAVEASRRIVWLLGRPLKASESLDELTKRGWHGRQTKTPIATLCADLEHARLHFRRVNGNQWALTPAADLLERARAIFEVACPDYMQDHLRQWTLRTPPHNSRTLNIARHGSSRRLVRTSRT